MTSIIQDSITSLELYLDYQPKTIVQTFAIEDVACGMYPCYYFEHNGHLKVSTSVISLIKSLGNLDYNSEFSPNLINDKFYGQRITIDKRINKLHPFETKTANNSHINFQATKCLHDIDLFLNESVKYYTSFIQQIEKKFPNYQHVVLTSGKDSLLINLAPKIDKTKWHIFSSEPNTNIVLQFMEENNLTINEFFIHDNADDEDLLFVMEKVVNLDCLVNPAHYRWLKALQKIKKKFKGKCIFWTGSMGDTINSYYEDFAKEDYKHYFETQFNRAALWQGMYHQLCFNLAGSPLLSIYHSPEIWHKLYQHFDPAISLNQDHRFALGEMLAKKSIKWPTENPGPKPWQVSNAILEMCLPFYKNHIEKELTLLTEVK